MKRYLLFLFAAIVTIFTQCESLKNLPTNTSTGLFSLNGNWQLTSSSDNRAMEGTVVQVMPAVADGTIRSLANNNYCLRERDALWQAIKNAGSGVFSLQLLVNACTGSVVYKPATLTVVSNDEVKIAGHTATGTELNQTWKRVVTQE